MDWQLSLSKEFIFQKPKNETDHRYAYHPTKFYPIDKDQHLDSYPAI
ncbi:hypothetical protein RV10_GL002753 [Enterococcus pallens]|nr:hypothetical protein RV10_GL002752 [Enterococcus pallens]OJG81514.1 hypothetical protein RV10_GL002753 [Enterococcus pallens]